MGRKRRDDGLKLCRGCSIVQPLEEFPRSGPDGYYHRCKACCRVYREANKSRISEYLKSYQVKNADHLRSYCSKWKTENRDHLKRYGNNLAEKGMCRTHPAAPAFRKGQCLPCDLAHRVRARVRSACKAKTPKPSTETLIGCSAAQLKIHIESLFTEGMAWSNHGPKEWHIDHRTPLKEFDLSDGAQMLAACHYTNLQPLWWYDNLKKGPQRTYPAREPLIPQAVAPAPT